MLFVLLLMAIMRVQVLMDIARVAWIRCAMITLGAQQRELISITILDFYLDVLLVVVISYAQITIV